VTHEISRPVLRLPIYPSLLDDEVERVVRPLAAALDEGAPDGTRRGAR